jgi:hypothetical protein
MKTKNLVLAAAAFLVAVGVAFGTSDLINPVYILAKVSSGDPFTCQRIDMNLCDNVEGTTCIAQVTIAPNGVPTVVNANLRKLTSPTVCVKLQGQQYDLQEFEFFDISNQ